MRVLLLPPSSRGNEAAALFAPTRPQDVFRSPRHAGRPRTLKEMEEKHLCRSEAAANCEAFLSFDCTLARTANVLGGLKVRAP
jgi:hypothetical protein